MAGKAEPKKMTLKMPKELEMPKMKDHQMFDRARIVELQNELQDNFKALKVTCNGRGGVGGVREHQRRRAPAVPTWKRQVFTVVFSKSRNRGGGRASPLGPSRLRGVGWGDFDRRSV